MRAARCLRAGAAAAVLALLAAGCGGEGNTLGEQAMRADNQNYAEPEDALVQQIAEQDRSITIDLAGVTLEGEDWDSQDARGEVVVINIWGSWCPPCVAEAEDLQAAYQHFIDAGEPVRFIGINERDPVATAKAFQDGRGVGYPSLRDDGGQARVSLQGTAAGAIPATLVLDTQGRLASRVLGPLTQATLVAMVEDVLAE